ncbi:kinase-like domain-containing protein [Fimicolochytrium jonesii]|uniref:kinase-like domain-containing protein n=1 Tax=Fimicolochytrium jonesii TaxID=1396493 RepID=UPI0022FECF99|nr:kinase-like domain-containing protein [Fimicolochytrium jonesii]KAI8817366.1 kinase-like domain-containing protein [Fimicolochytrium jonesii]
MGLIHEKAKEGDVEAIEQIVQDPEQETEGAAERDQQENTVLHVASKAGKPAVVDWCLRQSNVDLNALNVAGDTPLILASALGALDIVKKLVAKGAEVNQANDHGNTALHYACFWRHQDVAVYLTKEAGAWVAIKNKYQKTPLGRTSLEIREELEGSAEGAQTIQAPARTFAQAKEEAKTRFLAKGGVDWEIAATTVQTVPEPLYVSHHIITRRGKWNNYNVIIRTPLNQKRITAEDVRQLRTEIGNIRKLFHPNLLPILAACITPPNVGVLTEYMPRGDLWTYLHEPSIEISLDVAMAFASGVCAGLLFLHEQDPPVAHSNLKSQNILLGPDLTPKLTDYGITNPFLSPLRSTTSRYLARTEWLGPELLRGPSFVKDWKALDVYAYGILLHEIVTRAPPYENMNAMIIGMKVLLENMRPEIPEYTPEHLSWLMSMCWAAEARHRPSMSTISQTLANPDYLNQINGTEEYEESVLETEFSPTLIEHEGAGGD